MPKYNIYAGLGGGFGGANYRDTVEFETKEEAEDYAWELATETYGNYEGLYGLQSWDDIEEETIKLYGDDTTEDDVKIAYNEAMESWLSYHVEEVTE